MSEIGKRILERLELLGKSASAASLEAGLGRSALQDIITGKSQNPRLDTLRKLTEPLECSLSFLTGDPPDRLAKTPSIEWGEQLNEGEQVHRVEIVGLVQMGTIRGREDDLSEFNPVLFIERDQRFKEANLFGFIMSDRSLEHLNIQVNDVMLAILPGDMKATMRTGAVVIVQRFIPHAFDSEDHIGSETTAREVQYVDDDLHLTSGSKHTSSKPIIVPKGLIHRFARGESLDRPMVQLMGIVVRIIREMPV